LYDFKHLFPRLLERPRLFRLFAAYQDWTKLFQAEPWDGFHPDPDGFVHLSIASFSL
jgi:hypothetical protein